GYKTCRLPSFVMQTREPSGEDIILEPSGNVLTTLPSGPTMIEGAPLGLKFGLGRGLGIVSFGTSGAASRSLSWPLFACGVGGGVTTGSGADCLFVSSLGLGVSVFRGVLASVVAVGLGFVTTFCTGLPTGSAVATGLAAGDGVGSPNFTTASF